MATAKSSERTTGIPEGYMAVPIDDSQPGTPLRLCVLVRQTPDPASGHLVLLRDLFDALVYLGCVTDAGGRIREWIELWIQNVDGLEASLPAVRQAFSNDALDQRWKEFAEGLREANPLGFLETGWESEHPLPTLLDVNRKVAVRPGEGTPEGRWELCRDDAGLQRVGLPAYSTSLFRYLYQPQASGAPRLVSAVGGAPTNASTITLGEATNNAPGLVPLNPQGGLMLASTFHPIAYDEYVDLLGGKGWKGIEQGKKHLRLDGIYETLDDWNQMQQSGAHLFLGASGRAGRHLETFHLRLQLFADAVRLVRTFVKRLQVPFLNLGPDSFRVNLSPAGHLLPYLWTARCALMRPSEAFALPIEASDYRYFIRARAGGTSIYLPEGLSAASQGSGSVRIRKVLPPEQNGICLEGTLVMQERLAVSPHDLLWIRLPLPSGRIDLYGNLYTTEGLAQGEARFRTLPQQFPEATVNALRGAEGVSFARSPFEIVPLLSSPCDLFSLGVLGVRTFLVDEKTTLAVALDEVLSLARQVASEHNPEVPLGLRVRAVFEKDQRYMESLGPHRLARDGADPKQMVQIIPPELWYDTLGTLLRFFPGMGPDSACKDFGDAPTLALDVIFTEPLESLQKLLLRSRSLIVIDWNYNREVNRVIRKHLDKAGA